MIPLHQCWIPQVRSVSLCSCCNPTPCQSRDSCNFHITCIYLAILVNTHTHDWYFLLLKWLVLNLKIWWKSCSSGDDHTLGNESKLLNLMCVLVLDRGNGTQFNATHIQEEDIVELCVEVGQTHPEGVLQLSVTESVILFQSSDKMLLAACRVTKAMAWHKEPIRLHTSPPSTTHLRAYIAGRDGWPSGTQYLTPDKEEFPQSPPSNPHLDGRAQHQFHMDLGDAQLKQLMEDLQCEVAHRELNLPPGAHP